VILRVHGWEDYLTLGVAEIRQYGATSIQVVRALRATLETLNEQVRAEWIRTRASGRRRLAEGGFFSDFGGLIPSAVARILIPSKLGQSADP